MRTIVDLLCMDSKGFKEQLYDLKLSAINCCVNIPIALVSVLLQLGDKENVLKNLFDLLDYEMTLTMADEYAIVYLSILLFHCCFTCVTCIPVSFLIL
jgi:hypothetical protein